MPEVNPALAARLLCCFFLGSIPFALVAMWGTGVDITTFGSGNPGFNNVLRYSKSRAALCLAGDAGKGLVAVAFMPPPQSGEVGAWLCGMAAVAGHCFSPFLGFNGGKGIATSAGVMLFLYPTILAPCVVLYVLLRMIGNRMQWREPGTIASISSAVLFVGLLLGFESARMAWLGFLLLAFVAWRHKKNFRVLAGSGHTN